MSIIARLTRPKSGKCYERERERGQEQERERGREMGEQRGRGMGKVRRRGMGVERGRGERKRNGRGEWWERVECNSAPVTVFLCSACALLKRISNVNK